MLPTKSNKGCTQGSLHRSGPYSLVLPTKSNQGCTQGSKRYTGPACCKYSHVCGRIIFLRDSPKAQGSTITTTGCCGHTRVCCRTNQRRVAPRVKAYKGLADQMLLGAYTCVLRNRRIQGCTQGSEVTKVWPSSCCCEHTHICFAITQQKSRLQGLGRPTSTESMQTENCRRISQYRVASKARVTKAWPT